MPGYLAEIIGDRHTLHSRTSLQDVPPGHRFQLFFHGLSDAGMIDAPEGKENKHERDARRRAADEGDWQTLETKGAQLTKEWVPLKNQKRVALQAAAGMGKAAADLLTALEVRTEVLRRPGDWHREAILIAPLATGLGNPHPVENGFAFLSPYGVPYLAGSGVKGVLRRAAEELALLDDASPWGLAHVWALFGFDENSAYLSNRPEEMTERERKKLPPGLEQQIVNWRAAYERWAEGRAGADAVLAAWKRAIDPQLPKAPCNWREASPGELARNLMGTVGSSLRRAVHWQGMLAIRDAFPDAKSRLEVDILNPHHKDYYEAKILNGRQATPHDAENPVPVFFLTVAPGARFNFSARPLPGREEIWGLLGDWRELLDAAFNHASDWLGFGAKTAVGYGAMERDRRANEAAIKQALQAAPCQPRKDEDRKRRDAEAAEAARRQAELDALPESEKMRRRLQEELASFKGGTPLNKDRYAALAGLLNRLAEQAKGWLDAADRNKAADAIHAAFERFGWAPSGLRRDQRERQERKRRDLIATVRRGGG